MNQHRAHRQPPEAPVWPTTGPGLIYGCDYNPEQWDRAVWADDVRLMVEAGVTLVAVNIFGWSSVEPVSGEYRFDDLDEVIRLLHEGGIGVNLGTGTSSPPPWLTTQHPEILPQAADGTTRWPGGRQAWCPSSPVFREHALALTRATAQRYGSHPAVRLWHISNELGCHNAHCYCDVSAAAFRVWLRERYGSIDALNAAWGTTFWSQHYAEWDEILPPRETLSFRNPAQTIDFNRFSSDELLSYYRAEAAVIRESSSLPVTTNFMVTAHIRSQDYWQWAPAVDLVSNDHYLDHRLPAPERELSFAADATRGLAGGHPWLLMEHATSAVNWQPQNRAKDAGEMMRNSLTHVARGADGVCFFQWRASRQGSEKFHSAMVPHAGTDTRVWREAVELGQLMGRLGEVAGSRVQAQVALVFSWESWWATDLETHPSDQVTYLEQVHAVYEALWALGVTVDVVQPGASLEGYRLAVVPALYLVSDAHAAELDRFVAAGGSAFVTFFSGIVDENDSVRLGGYPGAFRSLLGVTTEEFYPLPAGATLALDDGTTASIWAELLHPTTAEVVTRFADGQLPGGPAVTRNRVGDGWAWYAATALDGSALVTLLSDVCEHAAVETSALGAAGTEVVRRRGDQFDYVFVLNHGRTPVIHDFDGYDLVGQRDIVAPAQLPAGGVHIIRQPRERS